MIQNWCIGNSNAMDSTLSSQVLKRFYQAEFNSVVAGICEDDFNAFRLEAQVRLLLELVKGSNLPSIRN